MGPDLYYSGLSLDRASSRRGDPAWVSSLLASPDSRVLPLWNDRCVGRGDSTLVLRAGDAGDVLAAGGDPVLLGLDGDGAVFAVDLAALTESDALALAAADRVVDVRGLVPGLRPAEAGVLAYARGILHWHRNQRFCGACGGSTAVRDGGHLRTCDACGKLLFPRIEPAVIVLVELPGEPRRCLLGRHRGSRPDGFTTLAGFVEIGESLEDAVRREIAEESGVVVGAVHYQGSQSWPFPAGLMVGFRAEAASDAIDVDGVELVDARWFTEDDLQRHLDGSASPHGRYPVDSIGKLLIEGWLANKARSRSRRAPHV